MAITRLTDIITVFDNKWTYGDVKFGYDGEVNQDHDTQYPLMLVNPPESIMPVVYDGREEYSFEINFYNLYSQAAQSAVTLQKRWDNLQDLSNEWLDMVLKNYQDVTVEAYLNDESIEIERIKDTQNDKLVQIKLTFTMSAFTKCFRPVSNYPSDFTDLVVWLRADSGVTFDIPTKRVSTLADSSGEKNNVSQSTVANQPLRNGYGGQNDKSYLSFDADDYLTSDSNCPIGTDFTIFEVSKIDAVSGYVFNYSYSDPAKRILMGINANGHYSVSVLDGEDNPLDLQTENPATDKNHIGVLIKQDVNITLNYYDSATASKQTNYNASFNASTTYNESTFSVGVSRGQFQELIVYNRALSNTEVERVTGYLNLKYKIY